MRYFDRMTVSATGQTEHRALLWVCLRTVRPNILSRQMDGCGVAVRVVQVPVLVGRLSVVMACHGGAVVKDLLRAVEQLRGRPPDFQPPIALLDFSEGADAP
ncbi:hypothetical protein GCM10009540_20510 [Streptomyces turgidiscabies]